MPIPFLSIWNQFWAWFVADGLNLVLLILLAFLVPRVGRLAMRVIESKVVDENEDESKAHLAFAGVAIYIAQLLAYFVIFVFILKSLGFSLAGAAIPATAASAAIGLGAQSIIADFLAGFFVLSEKQYGVGDWVRFEGGATTVEGTVIQITMRATRIRTLAEETVIIPNSKAGVSINNSNYWSSAVVTMPIPLLGSHSINEAIQRATAATQRALDHADIAQQVLGKLNVHESVGVTPPSTVGMPWTVDVRFVVQVRPGTQWGVERAIRTSIIDEFWQEYGSAPTTHGTMASELETAQPSEITAQIAGIPSVTDVPRYQPAHDAIEDTEAAPTQQFQSTVAHTTALPPIGDAQDPQRAETAHEDPANAEFNDLITEDADNEPEQELQGWRKHLTLGGKMRVSTAVLLTIFVTALLLKGLSWETDEDSTDSSGWLAPNRHSVATSETIAPEPAPEETIVTNEPVETTPPAEQQSDNPQPNSATPRPNDNNTEDSRYPNSEPETDEDHYSPGEDQQNSTPTAVPTGGNAVPNPTPAADTPAP